VDYAKTCDLRLYAVALLYGVFGSSMRCLRD
jgi:hypothetical protein